MDRIRLGVDLGCTWSTAVPLSDDTSVPTAAHRVRSIVSRGAGGGLEVGVETTVAASRSQSGAAVDDVILRAGDPTPANVDGVETDSRALFAALFDAAVAAADPRAQGFHEVAIAIPPTWGAHRRRWATDSVHRSRAGRVFLVNAAEAVVEHCAPIAGLAPGTIVLVVDAGGRHVACTAVRWTGESATQLGHADAIEHLGGVALDRALFGYCVDRLALRGLTVDRSPHAGLMAECTRVRELLSTHQAVAARLGPDAVVEISRDEFDSIAAPILAPVGELVDRTLDSAGIAPPDVALTVLVGGLAPTPVLRAGIGVKVGNAPWCPTDSATETASAVAHWLAARHSRTSSAGGRPWGGGDRVLSAVGGGDPAHEGLLVGQQPQRRRSLGRRWMIPAALAAAVSGVACAAFALSGNTDAQSVGNDITSVDRDPAPDVVPTPSGTTPAPSTDSPRASTTTSPPPSPSQRPEATSVPAASGVEYRLVNSASGLSLGLPPGAHGDDSHLCLCHTSQRQGQVWSLERVGSGWVLVNVATKKVAAVPKSHPNGSTAVVVKRDAHSQGQVWRLLKLPNGHYTIRNALTAQVIYLPLQDWKHHKKGSVAAELSTVNKHRTFQQWILQGKT